MLLTQLDMPTARYVCYANEGFISYRIGAKRQYIEFEQSENISNSSFVNIFHESEYIDRRKNKSKNRRIGLLLLLLFFIDKFAPLSFDRAATDISVLTVLAGME